MDPKSRKIISWSVSIVVHTTLLFLVGRMALDHFLPAGEVDTNPTTFEVVGGPHGEQMITPTEDKTPDKSVPAPPKARPPKTHVAVEKEADEPPVKFIPDKNFNEIKPTEPDTTEDEVAKKEPPPDALPEKSVAANEDQAVENTENVPTEIPKEEEAPKSEAVAPAPQAPAPTAAPNAQGAAPQTLPQKQSQVSAPQAQLSDTGTPPAYGTPGTSLDVSKLEEMPGNQKPTVPYKARFYKHSGTVFIRAYIRKDGRVDLPILEKSSGYSELDEEAIKTYAHWRYKTNGASGWVTKPIRFNVK